MEIVADQPLLVGHALPDLLLHIFLVGHFADSCKIVPAFVEISIPKLDFFQGLPGYDREFVASRMNYVSESKGSQVITGKVLFDEFTG